jgi:hypothetical protein
MPPQLVTAEDRENYGDELISMTQRAAREVMAPELQLLRAENNQLRHQQQRQQYVEIERALDQRVPSWRDIYSDPAFSQWLSLPDEYSGQTRSQLLRNAVANSDAARVVRFYQGFQQEAGHHAPANQRSRRSPQASGNIYTRPQIKSLYEQRRLGRINDQKWAPLEADIVAAGREGRVVGAIHPVDGTEMSRWAR